jgi:hypothetical protein
MMDGLLLTQRDHERNRFGPCLAEMLRVEGFNWFEVRDVSDVDETTLAQAKIVILSPAVLEPAQIDMLTTFCQNGGRLVCLRPSLRLGQALDLVPTYAAQKGGFLRIQPRAAVADGLPHVPIQIHGMADHWRTPDGSDWTTVASLSPGDTAALPAGAPAVLTTEVGQGRVAIFAYDLGQTVVRIRQGDPARANTLSAELDGVYRPSEMFVGHLDPDAAQVPQADVHTALLAHVIDALTADMPLPRLWYYPQATQRSVVIMTSDGDWSKLEEFDELIDAVEARQGRITFYLVPTTRVTPELAAEWTARGHVISVHPDVSSLASPSKPFGAYALDEQIHLVQDMLSTSVHGHRERFGVPVRTVRQHAVRWRGYLDAARDLADLGVEMDLNYVSIAPFSATYMTGSGRPMRFIGEDGRPLDILQQSTLFSEDLMLEPNFVFSLKWSPQRALDHVRGLLDENLDGIYTPIGLNSHPVSFVSYSRPFVEGFLDMVRARGVPIVTAEEWNAFTRLRDASHIADIVSTDIHLSFTLTTPRPGEELTVAWPVARRRVASVSVEGGGGSVTEAQLWRRPFALLTLRPSRRRSKVTVTYTRGA